jgi:hypothetical protein
MRLAERVSVSMVAAIDLTSGSFALPHFFYSIYGGKLGKISDLGS